MYLTVLLRTPRLALSLKASSGVSISVNIIDQRRKSVIVDAYQIALFPSNLPHTSTPLSESILPSLFPLLPSNAAPTCSYPAFEQNFSPASGPLLSTF